MLLKYLAIGVAIGPAALVLATGNSADGCHQNNCLRALNGTRIATRQAEATRDCSAYYVSASTTSRPKLPTYATACSDKASTATADPAFTIACSCMGIHAVPQVELPSPTALFGDAVNRSPSDIDDPWTSLDLPFPVTIYGLSNTTIYVSVNGFFSLNSPPPPIDRGQYVSFSNENLPVNVPINSESNYLPPLSVCGFWDDLFIFKGTYQGIYYQIDGSPGSRILSLEYYTSHFSASHEYYHFIMRYKEDKPNVVTVRYYQVSDDGVSATIGAQSVNVDDSSKTKAVQWPVSNGISAGETLRIDTNIDPSNPAAVGTIALDP
ncbi:hypothetical protein Dda_4872 [Drechslerella dactyloides]|uniref:Uncharacterized protein n=1 Tax=Drechslerella dactyloides TaxID=74499 RepID=A0AAD6IXQ3_DREDA|nr:hypothetical protein Dda_4872 [Drechslerella dactyloides]